MKIIIQIVILICLFNLEFWGQTFQTDSLFVVLQNLPNDTTKLQKLYDLGREREKENVENGRLVFQEVYALAQDLSIKKWLAKVEYRLARNYGMEGKYDTTLLIAEKCRENYESINDLKGLARIYDIFQYVYKRLGDFEKANEYAFKSLKNYEQLEDTRGMASATGKIGSLFYTLENWGKALEYAQNAYELAKTEKHSSEKAYAARLLADIYVIQDETQKAISFLNEALRVYEELDQKQRIITSLISRGNLQLGEERYEEALQDFEKSREMSKNIGLSYFDYTMFHNIADAHFFLGNYSEALKNYQLSIASAKESDIKYVSDKTYERLAITYSKIGQFDSAFYYQTISKEQGDSLLNAENSEKIAELQTQYETAQKETVIAQQEEQLTSQRITLWAGLIILLLALSAGLILFRLTQKLRKRNEEKEFLIKEIHHRVKNNLQVLSSLLNIQSRQIKDETALDAVREGQNRVEAMSLIHQKLYMGDNLASIDMGDYLYNLGDTLLDSFGFNEADIQMIYHIDPLRLDVDTAIPLGLIINELVTNSLKYAFPDEQKGKIEITLWVNDSKQLCLKVSDNGVGIGGAPELKNSTSFGTNLVQILCKRLEGVPEIQKDDGYSTLIKFDYYKMA